MKILVCGGQDYANPNGNLEIKSKKVRLQEYHFVLDTLQKLFTKYSKEYNPNDNWLPTDITIISGHASGVDLAAEDAATINWTGLEVYPANWKKYFKAAGPIRNQQMLKEGKPDLVVAFPGGKGTAHMISIAEKAGIPVRKFG